MDSETLYVASLVAYDGTDFHGFQYQAGVSTVQGTLENALAAFAEPAGRVAAAGRTDGGVHASGQVIAVRVKWRHDAEQLQRAWNAHLPATVCVRSLQPAPETFHPRFSALWRTYRYRLMQGSYTIRGAAPNRSPLTDRFAWYVPHALDLGSMQAAADELLGEHDFATFGQPTQGESTVRSVTEARWQVDEGTVTELDAYPGRRIVFTITANGFLRQMVRTLTGTLVETGLGRRTPQDVKRLLCEKDRSLSAAPAPARGLALERVTYADGAGPAA